MVTPTYEIFKNKHPTTSLQVENILDLGYFGVMDKFLTVKYVSGWPLEMEK